MTGQAAEAAADLRREAGAAAGDVRREAGAAARDVRREASGALEELRGEGKEVAAAARDQAAGLAEEGKRAGAAQAEGWARALHRAAESLEQESPQAARLVHDAAGSVDGLARGLRDSSPGELMNRVQDMARRQPVGFFGAAVLAGFALSRFARSSAEHGGTHQPGFGMRHDDARSGQMPQHGDDGPPAMAARDNPPAPAALGAPGWVPSGEDGGGGTARPATMAGATLGGAAARPAGADPSEPIPMPGPDRAGTS